jgi:signal transduction histidine kinase/CheY-like chemotaxis protein
VTAFVGRLRESQQLQAALEDRASTVLVVRGPSGVGKTALVDKVLHGLPAPGPILGRSKYAEETTNVGLKPIVDALSQAVDAALGRLYDPAAGVASLRALLGAQSEALLAAGFTASGLAAVTADAPAATLLSRQGTARLVDAIVRVLQWLDGFALPVVLFIDDWHRAPNEAVGFVHACRRRSGTNALKLVLAARSEGAMAYSDEASVVELKPLAEAERVELLTRMFGETAKAQAVMQWLGDQATGLPFDLVEIALALRHEGAFAGNGAALHVDPKRAAAIDHRDINNIIVQRARTLPSTVLRLGVAAALWGDRADLEVLGTCLSQTPGSVRSAAEALQLNGLLRIEGDEIAFLHDRIRASVLRVPDGAQLRGLAHAMSDILLATSADNHRQTALRLKLMGGIDEVREARLAALFAAEAASARLATQFDLAADFGEAAWTILGHTSGLTPGDRLAVLREACFAAAHRRQPEATRERCALMISAASDGAELADVYERSVIAMRLAGTVADAWSFCRDGLARFGVPLPDRIGKTRLLLALLAWKLVGRKPRRLFRFDVRTEQAALSFANSASYVVYEHGPHHAAYMAIRMAIRARLMGYDSALAHSTDAYINCALRDYRAAAKSGDRVAADLASLGSARGMTLHRSITFGRIWRDPLATLVETNRRIYDLCIAENDLVGAANAVRNEALWTWRSAPTLDAVATVLDETDGRAERLGDARGRAEIAWLTEVVRLLRRPDPLPARLPDNFVHGTHGDSPITFVEYLGLAGQWPMILSLAREARTMRASLDFHVVGVTWRFYESLARLKTGLPPDRRDVKFIERVAKANPTDHLGRVLLLRAEHAYRRGKKDCLRTYSEALEVMQKGSSRLEAGLTAESAAAAARDLGDSPAHDRFRAAATAIWSEWGAFAKLAALDARQLDASVRARLAEAEAAATIAKRGERAKSRFLAEVGHELRTPLQAMQGLLDLAAERPEELNLGEIREVFGSLKSVVDDLTTLGALGAEAPLNLRTADLAQLLRSELGLVEAGARQKGLALHADLFALQGRFFAVDPDRIRQVVRNLLSNAVKYTEVGKIELKASIADGTNGRSAVVVAVEDTGPGIPEERLSHLFEPFDRAGRKDARGLGLGLALSRRIAERLSGSLTAESRGADGSRFVFTFAAETRDAPTEPGAQSRPLTILIVEDTQLIRRLLARLLTIDGHRVIEAGTLAQGLEQARRQRLDLVLLDLHLPDGDGLSLLEQWPADRLRPLAIALTAAVTRETDDRVKSAGIAVLRKPIASADLRAAIAQACGRSETSKNANGFDTEMAKLIEEAREEIVRSAAELADLVRSDGARQEIRQHAHKLAGVAAQFGTPHVAQVADQIEQACAGTTPLGIYVADLERTLAETRA